MEHLQTSNQEGLQITTGAIEEKEKPTLRARRGSLIPQEEFREEAQSMKDQMGGMRAIDGLGSSADGLQTD